MSEPPRTPAAPGYLPGLIWMPDDQWRAGRLTRLHPEGEMGLVVHSGAVGSHVAEFLALAGKSCHVSWSKTYNQPVQQVPLTHEAEHAGSAGNDWYGLELPGPWDQDPRSELQRVWFQFVVGLMQLECASRGVVLRWFIRHSVLAPGRRSDRGPVFLDSWATDVGLEPGTPATASPPA